MFFLILILPSLILAQHTLPTLPQLTPLSPLPGLNSSRQLTDIKPRSTPLRDLNYFYFENTPYYLEGKETLSSDTLNLHQFIWLFLEGVAQGVETGGHTNPYYASNPYSSARGRWQMTNAFWEHYSYLYCDSMGLPRHILPRTPRNQRLIAYWAARDMFWRHYRTWRSPIEIISWMAKEWYGGRKFLNANWNIIPYSWQNRLTFRQYAQRVINKVYKLNQKNKKIILKIRRDNHE